MAGRPPCVYNVKDRAYKPGIRAAVSRFGVLQLYFGGFMRIREFCEKSSNCIFRLKEKIPGFKLSAIDDSLLIRTVTSILGASAFLCSIFLGGRLFYLVCFSLSMVSAFEWYQITGGRRYLYIPAIFVVALPYASAVYLYTLPHGVIILLWMILSVWSTDIGAYFVGKNFGKRKILPSVSPNKTWMGLFGGIAFSSVVTLLMSIIFGIFFVPHALFIGAIIAVIAQCGDFVESGIKRLCKVKDSGFIVPGHGGILDRIDGFMFTAPVVAYYIQHVSKFFAVI
ncbi:phosphatidate cytidylyltransferase [Anaplasma capra]|uniref:phosphatidate cytidylyltransferase n=1 Tax=Anaplasma capra TaxID=1562740 RepID=UPI0021D58438|nr:phosphatidate cytidylyltransferase [Anaplasma capra]MCU7611739.1 phosphatidate cytidylyltransferase [Anaplasma capra]MCU7612510.1 phosphatidate cytidylyltransferase [Anaplasma capra]